MHIELLLVILQIFGHTAAQNELLPGCKDKNNELSSEVNPDCDSTKQILDVSTCTVQLNGGFNVTFRCTSHDYDCCSGWKCGRIQVPKYGEIVRLLNGSILVFCHDVYAMKKRPKMVHCINGTWSQEIVCNGTTNYDEKSRDTTSTNPTILNTRFGFPDQEPFEKKESKHRTKLPRVAIVMATIFGLLAIVATLALFVWVKYTRRANVCWSRNHPDPEIEPHSEASIPGNIVTGPEQQRNEYPMRIGEYEDADIHIPLESEEIMVDKQTAGTDYVVINSDHRDNMTNSNNQWLEYQRRVSLKKKLMKQDSTLAVVEEERPGVGTE